MFVISRVVSIGLSDRFRVLDARLRGWFAGFRRIFEFRQGWQVGNSTESVSEATAKECKKTGNAFLPCIFPAFLDSLAFNRFTSTQYPDNRPASHVAEKGELAFGSGRSYHGGTALFFYRSCRMFRRNFVISAFVGLLLSFTAKSISAAPAKALMSKIASVESRGSRVESRESRVES